MPYQSNVVGSIADLMGRQAQIEAERQQRVAEAQARAQEVGAQAWSGAVGNIAQAVTSGVGNIMQMRRQGRLDARQAAIDTSNEADAVQRRALGGLQATNLENQNADYAQQQQFRKDLSDVFRTTEMVNEDGGVSVYDVPTITGAMAQRGHGDRMPQTIESLNGMNNAFRQEAAAKQAVAQRGAQELLRGGADYNMTMAFLDTLQRRGTYTKEQLDRVREHIDADPANNLVPTLQMYAGPQKNVVLPANAALVPEIGGTPIATNPVAPRPTAGATPTFTAEDRLLPDGTIAPLRWNNRAGEWTNEAGEVVRGSKDAPKTAAPRAPRLPADPIDVTPDIQTTFAGNKYLDLSSYTAAERPQARKAAQEAGVVTINKDDADAIREIDNARLNQQDILAQVSSLLPKDAMGRVVAAPGTLLSKIFQSDDQIAAFNTWRSAAIQALRATAGSKGFRINRDEIELAIQNDLPKLTDTLGAARQKNENVNSMLTNAERPLMMRDRSQFNTTTNPPAPGAGAAPIGPPGWKPEDTPGFRYVRRPNSTLWDPIPIVPPPAPRPPAAPMAPMSSHGPQP